MPKISAITTVSVPKLSDKLVGTSVGGSPNNETYNFTLQQLKDLFGGSSINAISPLFYNVSTGNLTIQQANGSQNGYLSAADWNTFNSKQPAGNYVTDVSATTPLFSSGGTTPNLTIQQANGSQNGYLSAIDWNTFNAKQAAGNYITSLSGEASATGPGAALIVLNNSAVTGKVLTGLNVTGGSVNAADSILSAFGKVQNQINGLIGGTIYQGVWNASTNTPTLASSVGTKGHYYIVNVAGSTNLNGITDWAVGDWVIFDGTAWQQVDNTDAVTSVNGFTGAVSLTTSNIPEGTNLYYLDSRARQAISLTTVGTSGAATYNNLTGVLNIPNYTTDLSGYVPYTGATSSVVLGANNSLTAHSLFTSATAEGGLFLTQNSAITGSENSTTFSSIKAFTNRYLLFSFGQPTALKRFRFDVNGLTDNTTLTYTMPNTSGTLALTSDIPSVLSYVPYTGATANVDLGSYNLRTNSLTVNNESYFDNALAIKKTGYTLPFTLTNKVYVYAPASGTGLTIMDGASPYSSTFTFSPTADRTYALPDTSGTLALTSDIPSVLSYVPYTGATANVDLGTYGLTSDYLGLNQSPSGVPTTVGTISWDTTYLTPKVVTGVGNTTLQIGQEEVILVHNNTGSALTDGQVVYVTGSTGDLPSVSLADASSETTSAATLGVVTESIANGANGFVTVSGIVNGLNTLAFNEGDLLWLSETAGQFTNVKPISPAHLVLIGYVIKKSGGNGSILVKIQNTQELKECSDVLITSPVDGEVLKYDGLTGLWVNGTGGGGASVMAAGTGAFSIVGSGSGNTASNTYSAALSGFINTASGYGSIISGGAGNNAIARYSTIGGGNNNTASANFSTVGGGQVNRACNYGSVVSGGVQNQSTQNFATVSGGYFNNASGAFSFIGGGFCVNAAAPFAGGFGCCITNNQSCTFMANNFVIGDFATGYDGCSLALDANGKICIGSGGGGSSVMNAGSGTCSIVGSGSGNIASGAYSFVGGGFCNTASGTYSFVGGGRENCGIGFSSIVGGGILNVTNGQYSFIGGGESNSTNNNYSFIGSGINNTASSLYSSVIGGNNNTVSSSAMASVIVGGSFNTISNYNNNSAILGGCGNSACAPFSAVFGCGLTNIQSCTFMANNFVIGDFSNGSYNGCSLALDVNGKICIGSGGGGGSSVMNAGTGLFSIVGSGSGNTADCNFSAALSGNFNTSSGIYAVTVGGNFNSATGPRSFIGNGSSNTSSGYLSFIGTGINNLANNCHSFIGGGESNNSIGTYSFIGSGKCNNSRCAMSTISGGYANNSCGMFSFIGSGRNNTTNGCQSFVGGGCCNVASGDNSIIVGGNSNTVCSSAIGSVVVGGSSNVAGGAGVFVGSFVGGGFSNSSLGNQSSVVGGFSNTISAYVGGSFIGGGGNNTINSNCSIIGGGKCNTTSGLYSSIVGGDTNIASGTYSFIGGGFNNTSSSGYASIAGGKCNFATDLYSFVGGGANNTASGLYSSVSGGGTNIASGSHSFVGSGLFNCASGSCSFIGAGRNNNAANVASIVSGGRLNTASGTYSIVVGGYSNFATGSYSNIFGGFFNTNSNYASFIVGKALTSSADYTTYVNALSKTSGTFRISHPDPSKTATKYLQHSFVESPTRGDNIYRFSVCAVNCKASVQLPDYYKFLNENDQVWISPKNHFGAAYGVIDGTQSAVDITSNADGEYNVLVIGTRKDKDAKDGFLGVEIWK